MLANEFRFGAVSHFIFYVLIRSALDLHLPASFCKFKVQATRLCSMKCSQVLVQKQNEGVSTEEHFHSIKTLLPIAKFAILDMT